MAIMSHEEEKKCPLCAEEMDWTDQQFKPCKCGYQVCVWCWHHIIDMAEKDASEGRCPACRTPYDKEKIVAMAANSERLVTTSSNGKHKPQKTKPKTSEVRKDLCSVRVIQRKMAYVIGLPLSLADEDLLQRKEYFGQYGKVTKLALSRTAGGSVQQFVNDTCSVYITYSKEEEAVRCIQSVHGYVLEDRYLRASFGTAKYCHAWLRNQPCTNPACLYLHNVGADEDSFSKDEVAAVHTRNIVHQIVGATQTMQRRSGGVLPPPDDEPFNHSGFCTENTVIKGATKDTAHVIDTPSGHLTCSLSSKDKDGGFKPPNKMTTFVDIVGRSCSSGPEKEENVAEDTKVLSVCSEFSSVTISEDNHLDAEYSDTVLSRGSASSQPLKNREAQEYSLKPYREPSNLSALMRSNLPTSDAFVANEQSCLMFDSGRQVLHGSCSDVREDLLSFDDQRSKNSESLSQRVFSLPSAYPVEISNHSSGHAWQHIETCTLGDFNAGHDAVNNCVNEGSLRATYVNPISVDGHNERKFQNSFESDRISRRSNSFSNEEIVEKLRRIDGDDVNTDAENSALDAVESSIISNILSMDFDACDDSLTLPHSLAQLFDGADGGHGTSWNINNSNQSRFSFAKQDSFVNQVNDNLNPSFSTIGHASKISFAPSSMENRESYFSKPPQYVSRAQCSTPPGFSLPPRQPPSGFSARERTDPVLGATSGSHLVRSSSLPNNQYHAPSAGNFCSTGDVDFNDPAILFFGRGKTTNESNSSGFDMRPPRTAQPSSYEDDLRLWLLMQQSASTTHQDPKFTRLSMQEAPSVHQELRFSGNVGNGFSSLNDAYGVSSRYVDQHQTYDPSIYTQLSQQKYGNGQISNGFRSSFDDVQHRNQVGVNELQKNERLGFNSLFPGYGDVMLQMPSSGNVYSRVYGM